MIQKIYILIILVFLVFIVYNNYTSAANLKDAFNDPTPYSEEGQTRSPLESAGETAGFLARDIDPVISTVIQATLSLLGVIFIILIIYGGGLWMTAKGNEQQVDKARNLITAAIIGLVIVVAAYAISYFVIKTIGGAGFKKLE